MTDPPKLPLIMTLPRRPARRRLSALATLATTALVAAGCGGGGAASKDEYAAELNDFCSQFLTATKDLQKTGSELGRNTKPEDAAKKLGGAIGTFSGKIGDSLSGLEEIEPPKAYEDFNTGLVKGLGEAQTKLDRVAETAKTGDVKSLSNIGRTLGGLDVPEPPKDLEAKATKCRG
jgi:hypothetical protein